MTQNLAPAPPADLDSVLVLSDLHLGSPLSRIKRPSQLGPLLEQAERSTVLFNGDSVELRRPVERENGWSLHEQLCAVCERAGVTPFFIPGNHDALISEQSHALLAGGTVFATHGDVLFPTVAPWSSEAPHFARERARLLGEGAEAHSLADEMALTRRLTRLESAHHEHVETHAGMVLRQLMPPWRPLSILKIWSETPSIAARFLDRHAVAARTLLIGHTHRAGIWQRNGRTIINTGAFLPLARSLAVRLENGSLTVHQVVERGGEFRLSDAVKN